MWTRCGSPGTDLGSVPWEPGTDGEPGSEGGGGWRRQHPGGLAGATGARLLPADAAVPLLTVISASPVTDCHETHWARFLIWATCGRNGHFILESFLSFFLSLCCWSSGHVPCPRPASALPSPANPGTSILDACSSRGRVRESVILFKPQQVLQGHTWDEHWATRCHVGIGRSA